MVNRQKILIVDDDNNIAELVSLYLIKECFDTKICNDGESALEIFDSYEPSLVLLDLMLPGMDGLQVCREIRKKSNVPIIMITAKSETFDKVLGLGLGADDYIVKPADDEELVLRVRALLRRSGKVDSRKLAVGATVLDMDAFTVERDGERVMLPRTEFLVLFKLLSSPDKVFTRRQLIDELWSVGSDTDERTVDVHISRLRRVLADNPDFDIRTVRGLGYKAVPRS